jgi:hypothetical protein
MDLGLFWEKEGLLRVSFDLEYLWFFTALDRKKNYTQQYIARKCTTVHILGEIY